MRERINRLAKGIVDQEIPQLSVRPLEIKSTLTVGTVSKGEFYVSSENGLGIKGLLYSTHDRVTMQTDTFHKLHNCITYEVNTEYMENGDVIEGKFHLITNAGEVEIPYSFHVCLAAAGKVLESLETVGHFAAVAKADWDTARDLFVYRNFVEAPFMKDMHIRTLYDGLMGGTDKDNLMEEFLIALKAKEAVSFRVDTKKHHFTNVTEVCQDSILLEQESWGYLYITAHADGDFIHLLKEELTSRDFEKRMAEVPFEILPEKMHRGKNFGSISICSRQGISRIIIEAEMASGRDSMVYRRLLEKHRILHYLKERLFYECGGYSRQTARVKLQQCLDIMETDQISMGTWIPLLKAELFLDSGQEDRAAALLRECREIVYGEKAWNHKAYGFYQYLYWKIYGGEEEKNRLIDYLHMCLEQERNSYFYLYLLEKIDKNLSENVFDLLRMYRMLYEHGCHSPFLYLRAGQLFASELTLLRKLEPFEFQVLWFGKGVGILNKELALTASMLSGSLHTYHKRQFRFFAALYQQYPETSILAALLGILIKGDCREAWCFPWYEKGIKAGIALTRLYEYYLYTLPTPYNEQLPKEILLYFSYGSVLDSKSKEQLYENIVRFWKPDSQIYRLYERTMERYALQQLFGSRINRSLAVLYDRMLYKEMIDVPVAQVLPAILKSFRIVCEDDQMRYVIVCSEELERAEAYPLRNKEAYVPLYSEKSVLIFQDAYGDRFVNVPFHKEKAMEHPEFLQRCFEVYPEHPMLRLSECAKIVDGVLSVGEIPLLERVLQEMQLKPLYRQKILEKILRCYQISLSQGDKLDTDPYLLGIDKAGLTKKERLGICKILIAQNHILEVFHMMETYHMDDIRGEDARKLVSRMILERIDRKEPLLLSKAFAVFQEGKEDEMILDYLCEHYNGTSTEMYKILETAIREKVETYDLEERLLGQMLFTGMEDSNLDMVFEWYTSRKKQDSSLVKAYFTTKCVEYFLNGRKVPQKVFTYLESMIRRILYKGKIPDIYQLALTRYYAEKGELTGEEHRLCAAMIQNLLSQGKVFPYFQKLFKWAAIPDDLMDKAMMEYHGSVGSRPVLMVRVLPDEENFHMESMRHMYKGIFVKEKVLFADETMEYKVAQEEQGVLKIREEGRISCQRFPTDGVINRITYINEICRYLTEKQDEKAKDSMKDYSRTTAIANTLFQLL